mgnify:CR=1 FL=1
MISLSYKRLLVKFSGEAVAGDDEHGIDPKILDQMAQSVKDCKEFGAQIGIVIGGGNLFRGEKLSKAGMDRVAGDHMGMLATVMNGIALRDALEGEGGRNLVKLEYAKRLREAKIIGTPVLRAAEEIPQLRIRERERKLRAMELLPPQAEKEEKPPLKKEGKPLEEEQKQQ